MIKIRLQRHGARHAPFYRMVVAPAQSRRDGRFIEVLGTYNPQSSARERELDLKMDRIEHWLEVGAQPTDTAKSLIRQGRLSPEDWLKRAESKASAKTSRAAKKKAPAPIAEETAAPEEVQADASEEALTDEPKAEEAPAPEAKEDAPAEEKQAEPETKEDKTEASVEEVPAPEAKEDAPVEEKAPEPEAKEEKVEEPAEEAKPEPEAKAEDKVDKKEGEES